MTRLSCILFVLFALNTHVRAQTAADSLKPYGDAYTKPEYRGGIDSLNAYITRSLRYPEAAREAHIEGRVRISFLISEDGSISKAKVVRGIGGGCDEEALRVVKTLPNWVPARYKGRATRAMQEVAVLFKLE